VRFSISKKPLPSGASASAAVHPLREAIIAGIIVAGSITLGAYSVYERARTEKLEDVRQHVREAATRLASLTRGIVNEAEKPQDHVAGEMESTLKIIDSNDTVISRVYSFQVDADEEETILDTHESGKSRPLPKALKLARHHFRSLPRGAKHEPWVHVGDEKMTGVALIDANAHAIRHAIGVEADMKHLEVRLAAVRDAFTSTAMGGVFIGFIAAVFVWKTRRRTALAQLEAERSRRMEDAVIQALGEIVYTYDLSTGTFRWRGKFGELFGPAFDETATEHEKWLEHIHPDDRQRYRKAFETAAKNRSSMVQEYRVSKADGSELWVLDRSNPIKVGDEEFLVGSLIDLTDRRTAEELLQLFFDETATAHLVFDGDEILDANPAALTLLGAQTKGDLTDKPLWTFWPRRQQPSGTLSAEAWAPRVHEAVEFGLCRFEWQFLSLDGRQIDCDVFLRHAMLQGRMVLLMACYDISPIKRAQALLIESEQRFRDVSEAVGEFIWEVDADGKYTYASRRVSEILGNDPSEVIGRSPWDWVHEDDREAAIARSEEITKSRMPFRNFEHRIRQPNGRVLWVSLSGKPLFDSAGALVGYRGVTLDITRHRAYEQELLLQKEAAEAAARAKSSFLAMMSHEIRTPLNSVLGFADLVLDTELTPIQREYLNTIKSSGDALLVLLNDILDFSKIESGRLDVETRPVDIAGCVHEVVRLYQLRADEKGLTITVDIARDVPTFLNSDGARLRQILLNLVGNAVKFTEQGGIQIRVGIAASTDDAVETLHIRVVDTGIGVPAELKSRLFQPFSQAESSTNRRFGGTGLGLAISKRLAHLLGGDLWLEDTPEKGATFHLALPAIRSSAEEIEKTADAGRRAQSLGTLALKSGPLRVLVVDDNSLNRRLTMKILEQIGAQPSSAASAEECFQMLETGTFDAILMDVQMPETDGLEATREIRRREQRDGSHSPIPIIALTADAMSGDRERCLGAGMTGYLSKPLRRHELIRALETAVSEPDSRKT